MNEASAGPEGVRPGTGKRVQLPKVAAGVTVKTALSTEGIPVVEAVSWYVSAVPIERGSKVAVPTNVVTLVVPWRVTPAGPVPLLMVMLTANSGEVTGLPHSSCTVTFGGPGMSPPMVALPGWVVKASLLKIPPPPPPPPPPPMMVFVRLKWTEGAAPEVADTK